MKYIQIRIYEDDEQPYINGESFSYNFTSEDKTLYFKIDEPFIWKEKVITGFFKGSDGIGWANGKLRLNQLRNFPVSKLQLDVFKEAIQKMKS